MTAVKSQSHTNPSRVSVHNYIRIKCSGVTIEIMVCVRAFSQSPGLAGLVLKFLVHALLIIKATSLVVCERMECKKKRMVEMTDDHIIMITRIRIPNENEAAQPPFFFRLWKLFLLLIFQWFFRIFY